MKTRTFAELASGARSNQARRRRIDEHKAELLKELTLAELRAARRRTQVDLAKSLQTTQSGVSRLEHQTDLYVSTLRSYVEALGGRLEIHGVFPDARVQITSFSSAGEGEAEATAAAASTTD